MFNLNIAFESSPRNMEVLLEDQFTSKYNQDAVQQNLDAAVADLVRLRHAISSQ